MQYIPCNSTLLAQETLLLTQKALFLAKVFPKVRETRRILILRQKKRMLGLKKLVQIQTFRRRPFVPSHNFCHPAVFQNASKIWATRPWSSAINYLCILCIIRLRLTSTWSTAAIWSRRSDGKKPWRFNSTNDVSLRNCKRYIIIIIIIINIGII